MSSGERPLSEVRFLTATETAALMRVSRKTVYRLVESGDLPAIRVGRSFRVPEQAVRDYMREQGTEVEASVAAQRNAGPADPPPRPFSRPPAWLIDLAADGPKRPVVTRGVSLDEHPELAAIARRAADSGEIVYLTQHGEQLAAIIPPEVAAALITLGDDEHGDLLTDLVDAENARRTLESIADGEPVVPWEEVKARLEL
jgi:excisionase family DNA binding protein